MKKIFFILLLSGISLFVKAEEIYFQHYGINEGLSSNGVFGIEEDKNGLLWITTTEGVDKFDGLNFTHYALPQLGKNGLVDYMEFHIKSDSKGQIYVATRTGLIYKYDGLKDEFQLIHQFQQKAKIPSIIRLRTIHVDTNDNLLIAMNDGVWQLHHATFQVIQVSKSGNVQCISEDNKHNYYWSDHRGIQVLDSSFQERNNYNPEGETNAFTQKITRLFIDKQNQTLWGMSEKKGVFFINLKNGECTFPETLSRYKNLAIRTISRFSDDEILIGVDGVGLVFWNTKTQVLTKEITYQAGKKGTLSSNAIYDIYRNRDGIFFIATQRGGINVYNPNKLNFGFMNSILNEKNSLTNNYILSLAEIAPGLIGFGTYEGISIWNKGSNQWQHPSGDEEISEVILSLSTDIDNNIWASSFTNSLMMFKNNSGIYNESRSLKEPKNLKSKSIFVDKQNRVWLTNHDGIYLYSISEKKVEHFPFTGLLTLAKFSENMLVLGTENGLSFFDTQKRKLHSFDFIDKANVDMRLVKSLRLDKRERLWVGTKTDGIFVVDFYNKTIKNISVDDGLPTKHVFGIAIAKNEVWVSTIKGISKLDKDFNVTNFTTSDGIASIDFNYDAALYDSDGMLYFGTNDGVVTLNPREISTDNPNKNIIFSEFRMNHKKIYAGEDSPLKTEPNILNEIQLKHHQNSFSLGFTSVDFNQPARGIFHWKLENFNERWLVSEKLSNINYANLNPGNYTFKIKALDEQGELISNEKTIHINISKPWWLSFSAFVLYAITTFLLLLSIIYFYRLRLNSKNASERLGFLINLAHEIKTPLLLIKAPLNDLMANENISGVVRKNINIALSSAERLHRQMIQFLDMGNLAKIENTLTLEHTNLVHFINEKITVFKVLAEKKKIVLSFVNNQADFSIKTDKRVLDKILSNLISNAIKYTKTRGRVVIKLQVEREFCKIRISDTGIGIIKSEQKNVFKPFYRTDRAKESGSTGNGMGLVLAANLAKMLKGKLFLVESSEKGSTFEFKFPYTLSEWDELSEEANEQAIAKDKRTRLLLVEDDKDLLDYGVSKLEEHYQVFTAKDGIEALQKCEQALPDVVISDVMMPKMNGLQLCTKLKTDIKTSHIPVILFTGLDSKEEIFEGLEAGADDYIVKPFEFDILIKKVEALLNNRFLLQKKFLFQSDEKEAIGFTSKLDDEWINEVTNFVEEHIENPDLNPSVLYKQFRMSRSAFYHKTKTLVDLSPIELIRTIRLKKAKTLLGTSDNDVSEVAYKLGFNTPKYFSTIFKRYYGQTPSSFIAEKRNLRKELE